MTHSLSILKMNTPPPSQNVAPLSDKLFDSHGRQIRDLRLSVTDRCNFRCIYCTEPDVKYLPKSDLLTLDEYVRVVKIALSLGIDKLRITGGEPTLYPQLNQFIEKVGQMGLRDIALTTNGSMLSRELAQRWKDSGLHRVTVSLDTLKPSRKDAITRSHTTLKDVIAAIDTVRDVGLTPVKVNAVILRGVNDDEVSDFARFAQEHEIDMRLIEFMALDARKNWKRDDVVTAAQMKRRIEQEFTLIRDDDTESSTSMNYRFTSGGGRIGFIASVSESFCHGCDRIRMMADGTVRPCLFSDDEWCIRSMLQMGASDENLRTFFQDAAWAKSAGHGMDKTDFVRPKKTMSTIGG
ncbi:MAG: GTP 3',8-cyclase MoaA [Planctomycetes bacterium]|nr:GTP 3',8-cyclase MoaA [Planctomycetota bacterium]